MVQAPVRALDPDGVAVVSAGTLAFAVGTGICWWQLAALQATGRAWYLGVAVAGTVIGLLGLAFGLFRKSRRRRRGESANEDSDALDQQTGTAPAPPAARSVEEALIDADGVPDRE